MPTKKPAKKAPKKTAKKKPTPKKKSQKKKKTASQAIERNKNKLGRPTRYLKAYDEQAYKLCLLGATDERMADIFNIAVSTLNLWKLKHTSFSESLKKGKAFANADVAEALYNRARGYSHDDVHIANYMGKPIITKITKHYPPDTGAAMAWLKNREPVLWKDRQDINLGGDMVVSFNLDYMAKDGD